MPPKPCKTGFIKSFKGRCVDENGPTGRAVIEAQKKRSPRKYIVRESSLRESIFKWINGTPEVEEIFDQDAETLSIPSVHSIEPSSNNSYNNVWTIGPYKGRTFSWTYQNKPAYNDKILAQTRPRLQMKEYKQYIEKKQKFIEKTSSIPNRSLNPTKNPLLIPPVPIVTSFMKKTCNYHVLKELGKGTFGNVYSVQKKSSPTIEALKVIRKIGWSLIAEILLGEYVFHPNVVSVHSMLGYDQCLKANKIGILLPLATGSLKDYNGDTKSMVTQLCDGLHYLHSKNILHLDIKQANILLFENNNLKYSDLGISFISPNVFTGVLRPSSGSPAYFPPEIRSKLNAPRHIYNDKYDVWTLGLTILDTLLKRRVYDYQNIVLEKNWQKEINDPKLVIVIEAMLEFDPNKRKSIKDILNMTYFKGVEIHKGSENIPSATPTNIDFWDWFIKFAPTRFHNMSIFSLLRAIDIFYVTVGQGVLSSQNNIQFSDLKMTLPEYIEVILSVSTLINQDSLISYPEKIAQKCLRWMSILKIPLLRPLITEKTMDYQTLVDFIKKYTHNFTLYEKHRQDSIKLKTIKIANEENRLRDFIKTIREN